MNTVTFTLSPTIFILSTTAIMLISMLFIIRSYKFLKELDKKSAELSETSYMVKQPKEGIWLGLFILLGWIIFNFNTGIPDSQNRLELNIFISGFSMVMIFVSVSLYNSGVLIEGNTVTVYRLLRNNFTFDIKDVNQIYNISSNGSNQTFVLTNSKKVFSFINISRSSNENGERFFLHLTENIPDDELSRSARMRKEYLLRKKNQGGLL